MAKRNPRSEADDTTAAVDPARQPRTSTGGGRPENASAGPARGRPGRQNDEAAPEAPDTFAARTEPTDRSERGSSEPTEEEIRFRAYELYVERGSEHGMDFDDWVRAEEELRTRPK